LTLQSARHANIISLENSIVTYSCVGNCVDFWRSAAIDPGTGQSEGLKKGEDNMTKKLLMLLLCSVVLLSGCGGSGTVHKGGDDPWDLFTQKEAEKVLGFKVEPQIQKIEDAGQKLVLYAAVDEKETEFIQVSVVRDENMGDSLKESGYNCKKLFEDTKKDLAGNKAVEGLGQEAFWSAGGLHIMSEGVYVTVSTGTTDKPEYLERAKEVAETIMERL
jgi:hypothetical protein